MAGGGSGGGAQLETWAARFPGDRGTIAGAASVTHWAGPIWLAAHGRGKGLRA